MRDVSGRVWLKLRGYYIWIMHISGSSGSAVLRPVSEIRILSWLSVGFVGSRAYLIMSFHTCGLSSWSMQTAAKFRPIFSDFPYFNYVQSRALDDVSNISISKTMSLGTWVYPWMYLCLVYRSFTQIRTLWHVLLPAPVKQCCLNWPSFTC